MHRVVRLSLLIRVTLEGVGQINLNIAPQGEGAKPRECAGLESRRSLEQAEYTTRCHNAGIYERIENERRCSRS